MELLGFIGPWQIIIIFLVASSFLLPIIALIGILRNQFTGNHKLIWVLVVIFFPFFGSILYFIMGSSHKLKNNL